MLNHIPLNKGVKIQAKSILKLVMLLYFRLRYVPVKLFESTI